MRVLWLGPLSSDQAIKERLASNAAAAKWTRGLLRGLKKVGVEIFCVTHCYERRWPNGEMFPGTEGDFDAQFAYSRIKYPNVPVLKDQYLSVAYGKRVKKALQHAKYDLVLCYNTLHPYHVAGMQAAYECGVPSYPIILDVLQDPRKDGWKAVLNQTQYAKGVIFLSQWAKDNFPGDVPSYQMEGGCAAWLGEEGLGRREPNLVLHAGGLDFRRGGDFLCDVIAQIEDDNVRFVFCGKVSHENINPALRSDRRVTFKGFVSDAELHDLYCQASLFLNAKDPLDGENLMNFPSKVSNYQPYGKPIVSTWLPSYPEHYRHVLIVPEDNSPLQFATCVQNVLKWTPGDYHAHCQNVKKWFFENKLWDAQILKLVDWINRY